MPIATVAAIIKNDEGKILLTRRNVEPFKGQWCLPGGHIDTYESIKDAIIREVKEETGLDFEATFFNYSDEIIEERDIHATVMVFAGRGSGQVITQENEVSEFDWFSLEEAHLLPLAFEHNKILQEYSSKTYSKDEKAEILAEYSALRDEVLKRMDLRQNILTSTVLIAGTILAFSVPDETSPLVLLLYPILALFLATAWTQNDTRIWDIAQYIENEIESKLSGIKWETYIHRLNQSRIVRPLEVTAVGVFLATEVITVGLALLKTDFLVEGFSTEEWVLLAFALISLVQTIRTVRSRSKAMKKGRKE